MILLRHTFLSLNGLGHVSCTVLVGRSQLLPETGYDMVEMVDIPEGS
jgi:hypothetical protein